MTGGNHPASSVEFLSRLHDGEVPGDEKAAFEEHRQSCADCRTAADAFEASLAAFRASDVVPTPADLSARILRKIRAQSPSRRPFGVMFGIDVRWAGVLAAALIAVLLSAPLVERRSATRAAMRPPISATLVEAPAEPAAPAARAKAAGVGGNPSSAPVPAPPGAGAGASAAADQNLSRNSTALEAPAEDEKHRFAPAPAAPEARRAPAAAARSRQSVEAPGGEAAAALDDAAATRPSLRLLVSPVDGQGEAPAIVEGPDTARLAELRGREYVLTVEASGRVRSIEPSIANGFVAAPNAKTQSAAPSVAVPGPLETLRFAPGDRPRRLALRVE